MNDDPRHPAGPPLTQTDAALANYLDTLLAEIDVLEETPTLQRVKEPISEADTLDEGRLPIESDRVDTQDQAIQGTDKADAVPVWAELPFQVLRFRVDGVNLAVPLMELTGIIRLDRPISRLPGQPGWNLGVVMNHDTKVVVVDTRRLMMSGSESGQTAYSHLLLLGDGRWGLAVESLGETATIDKAAIRWRGDATQHPWYGGIWVEELSVLLDASGVLEMLAA